MERREAASLAMIRFAAKAIGKGHLHRWISTLVAAGDTVIDVGACDGAVTEWFVEAVGPSGTVIAFEPDDRHTTYPGVDWRKIAIGEANLQAVPWYPAVNPPQSTRWRANRPEEGPVSAVPLMRLDDAVVQNVNAIKLDTQGWEMAVLLGADRHLRTCPIWILEVWPRGLEVAGSSVAELYDRMHAAGLRWYSDLDQVVEREDVLAWAATRIGHNYGNVLALR